LLKAFHTESAVEKNAIPPYVRSADSYPEKLGLVIPGLLTPNHLPTTLSELPKPTPAAPKNADINMPPTETSACAPPGHTSRIRPPDRYALSPPIAPTARPAMGCPIIASDIPAPTPNPPIAPEAADDRTPSAVIEPPAAYCSPIYDNVFTAIPDAVPTIKFATTRSNAIAARGVAAPAVHVIAIAAIATTATTTTVFQFSSNQSPMPPSNIPVGSMNLRGLLTQYAYLLIV